MVQWVFFVRLDDIIFVRNSYLLNRILLWFGHVERNKDTFLGQANVKNPY